MKLLHNLKTSASNGNKKKPLKKTTRKSQHEMDKKNNAAPSVARNLGQPQVGIPFAFCTHTYISIVYLLYIDSMWYTVFVAFFFMSPFSFSRSSQFSLVGERWKCSADVFRISLYLYWQARKFSNFARRKFSQTEREREREKKNCKQTCFVWGTMDYLLFVWVGFTIAVSFV